MPHRAGPLRWLVAALLQLLLAVPALAQERVALVIGNGAYRSAPPLANPANDARAMAGLLERLGFRVETGLDLDRLAMEELVATFEEKARAAEVAFVFYAGHGIQVAGRNYLVPIDASLRRESDVRRLIEADWVLESAGRARRLAVVFLDACRDNPLAESYASTSRSAAVGRGLASIGRAPANLLVAYATAADATAADGLGRHSPFTEALLEHLPARGVELRLALGRVRDSVARRTDQQQIPYTYGSLGGDEFYLARVPAKRQRRPHRRPRPPSSCWPGPRAVRAHPCATARTAPSWYRWPPAGSTWARRPTSPATRRTRGRSARFAWPGPSPSAASRSPWRNGTPVRRPAPAPGGPTIAAWAVAACPPSTSAPRTPWPTSPGSRPRPATPTGCPARPSGNMPPAPSPLPPIPGGPGSIRPWSPARAAPARRARAGRRRPAASRPTPSASSTWRAACGSGPPTAGTSVCAAVPADGRAADAGNCLARVLKGGSFLSRPHAVRPASRDWAFAGQREVTRGFRVARDLLPREAAPALAAAGP